jgi:hypothetical protein
MHHLNTTDADAATGNQNILTDYQPASWINRYFAAAK